MSDNSPSPERPAGMPRADDPIIAEARQAVARMFQSTFAALHQDLAQVVGTGAGPKGAGPKGARRDSAGGDNLSPDALSEQARATGALTAAVHTLTQDMVRLLRSRVESAFPIPGHAAEPPAASDPADKPL